MVFSVPSIVCRYGMVGPVLHRLAPAAGADWMETTHTSKRRVCHEVRQRGGAPGREEPSDHG